MDHSLTPVGRVDSAPSVPLAIVFLARFRYHIWVMLAIDAIRPREWRRCRPRRPSPGLWNLWTNRMERLRIKRTRHKVRIELTEISPRRSPLPEVSGYDENGLTNMSRTIYSQVGGEAWL